MTSGAAHHIVFSEDEWSALDVLRAQIGARDRTTTVRALLHAAAIERATPRTRRPSSLVERLRLACRLMAPRR